jgi:hypothetical protein
MNKLSLTLAASAICAIGASAQSSVEWLSKSHDFGVFSEDLGQVSTDFRMVNTGDAPLRIINARVTCGCTTPEYPTGDVAPGDTAVVTVAYNANGRPGRFDKKIYVTTSAEPARQHTLTIEGVVIGATQTLRSRYPYEAGALMLRNDQVNFGDVKRGKMKTIFIEAYNRSADTIVPQFSAMPECLTAQARPAAVPPGEQTIITFTLNTLKPGLDWGINDFKFAINDGATLLDSLGCFTLMSEDFSQLTPGQRLNAPSISVDNKKIDLGSINPTEPCQVSFTITNNGKDPLEVRRVQCDDPTVTATNLSASKIKKGKKATLTVSFDPSKAQNDFINARISVISNDPEESLTVVRITAELPIKQ